MEIHSIGVAVNRNRLAVNRASTEPRLGSLPVIDLEKTMKMLDWTYAQP